MRKDKSNKIRNIAEESKINNQKKVTSFDFIMGLLIGLLLYFGYYMLMREYFQINPFRWPYVLVNIYFILATILFPYSYNRVNAWAENNKIIYSLFIPQTSMLIAYIFAPIIGIIELF